MDEYDYSDGDFEELAILREFGYGDEAVAEVELDEAFDA